MESPRQITAITAGIIIAGLSIVFSLVANMIGGAAAGMGTFQYLMIIAALIIFVNLHGKANGYNKNFGDLFNYGFKATAIYTLIFLLFLSILLITNPEVKTQALDAARSEMEKKKMSDSDIDKGIEIASKYFWIGIVGGTMFFLVLVGAIGSLLGAAITKKIPNSPFDQPIS